MPSKKKQSESSRREQKYYTAMIRIAGEMGCHLKPVEQSTVKMRGLCPFHEATVLRTAQTLEVNTSTLRFSCMYCHASGPPTAFAAMAWNVSARDARELLDAHGDAAGAERPLYLRGKKEESYPNTAVFTRAMSHYQEQVKGGTPRSMPALTLAAALDLDLDRAIEAGMGVSTGEGLAAKLRGTGITEQEIGESPLFVRGETQREFLAGRVVLADTDYTGAAIWITSLNPGGTNERSRGALNGNRPGTTGISASRPYLTGLSQAGGQQGEVIVTDDVRLYLTAKSNGRSCVLWPGRIRNDTPEERDRVAARIAQDLERTNAGTLVLMMHDASVRSRCEAILHATKADRTVVSLGKGEVMRQVNPHTRDLDKVAERAGQERYDPRPPDPQPPDQGPGQG